METYSCIIAPVICIACLHLHILPMVIQHYSSLKLRQLGVAILNLALSVSYNNNPCSILSVAHGYEVNSELCSNYVK